MRKIHDEIIQCGKKELACLTEELFKDNLKIWGKVKSVLKKRGSDFEEVTSRVMGFGWYQTKAFSSIHEDHSAGEIDRFRLGALANLIVSLYDFIVDSGLSPVISQSMFLALLENKIKRQSYLRSFLFQNSSVRLMKLLVMNFSEKAIRCMGTAEWQNLIQVIGKASSVQNAVTEGNNVNLNLIEEKSIYPFLILAQIAQSAPLSTAQEVYITVLGKFIGMVDDLTDFEDDVEKGAINSINFYYMKSKNGIEQFREDFRKMIDILFVAPEINISQENRRIFVTTLNSWICGWPV